MHIRSSTLFAAALCAVGLSAVALALAPRAIRGGDEIVPHVFTSGTTILSSEVNANFSALSAAVSAIPRPKNLIVVATQGGDFSSVAEALASIGDSGADNPYTVFVAPGVYTETELSSVPAHVHLMGAGMGATRLTSARSANEPSSDAATLLVADLAAVSDLTIENTGSSASVGIAVKGSNLSRETRLTRVLAEANGAGGNAHIGVHVDDSDLTITDSILRASGAAFGNSAFVSTDAGGPFAQPRIVNSVLEAPGNSGFAMRISSTAARIEGSRLFGGVHAISSLVAGISLLRDCHVETSGLSPVFEQDGSASILSATTFFIGGNPIGSGSNFKYVHCFKANYDPIVDGTGSVVQ